VRGDHPHQREAACHVQADDPAGRDERGHGWDDARDGRVSRCTPSRSARRTAAAPPGRAPAW
jgi:hypothetical protein